jgi:two-component system, OmpR family, alkaline phosphatase synthesis response regulator PhoP
LNRSRGIRIERDRTRRPRPRLGDRRPAEISILVELGSRFRNDPRSPGSRSIGEQRILIVDDESAIRLICRVNLESAGFEAIEAGDGETALAVARSERPDLILLDVMLPGLDGWEVAATLRETPETRDIPIIFLTARTSTTDEVHGHAVGGVGYISKPFDPAELTQMVSATLQRVRRGERDQMRREWGRSIDD